MLKIENIRKYHIMRSVLRSLNIFNNNSRSEIENKSVKNDIQIKILIGGIVCQSQFKN